MTRFGNDPPPLSIVLIGLMGAGKSKVGCQLAQRRGLPFADADDEITRAAGLSIEEIFRIYGEPAFRDCERKVIQRLLAGAPKVVATGGGAFIDAETRRRIDERAVSIWLRADLDVLVARTVGRTHRPLLNTGDPRATLASLMTKRYPVYALADIIVDTGDGPVEATVDRVAAALATFTKPAPDPVSGTR